MSLEKVAKEVRGSMNSISSLYLLLSSVAKVVKGHEGSDHIIFRSSLNTLRRVFLLTELIDPTIKNILNSIFCKDNINNITPQEVLARISTIKNYIKTSQKKIPHFGCSKLIDGGGVFVFGHDSFISGALKYARSSGKKFKVSNTEMRPSFYGRKLAGELSKGGINLTHYTDSSLKKAMKGVDVVFCDCTSVLTGGKLIGTIGFELVADTAFHLGIPLYVCAPSWKIDTDNLLGGSLTTFSGKIWGKAPKGIKTKNDLFDIVDSQFITGIISELGVYTTQTFIAEAKYENMWKF